MQFPRESLSRSYNAEQRRLRTSMIQFPRRSFFENYILYERPNRTFYSSVPFKCLSSRSAHGRARSDIRRAESSRVASRNSVSYQRPSDRGQMGCHRDRIERKAGKKRAAGRVFLFSCNPGTSTNASSYFLRSWTPSGFLRTDNSAGEPRSTRFRRTAVIRLEIRFGPQKRGARGRGTVG